MVIMANAFSFFTFGTQSNLKMTDEEWIDVSVAQDGGVMKKILKEAPDGASGPPPKGNEIEAHYTGTSRSDPIDLV